MNEQLELSESEKERQIFSRLCHDYGLLQYQKTRIEADMEEMRVKIHNAEVAFKKAKADETRAHNTEATQPQGVTQ